MNLINVAAVREMFPDDELYYIRIEDDEFIVRTISPSEYCTIKELAKNKYDIEDLVTQTAMVYPAMFMVNEGPAGIPGQLSKIILTMSLLAEDSKPNIKNRFNYYTNQLISPEGIDSQLPIFIKMAFPEFTFEQIESWTIDKQLKNLARALYVLRLKGIPIDFEITDDDIEMLHEKLTLEEKAFMIEEEGGDPVMELYDEYKTKSVIVEEPFLGSTYWQDEVVIDAIQRQIWK